MTKKKVKKEFLAQYQQPLVEKIKIPLKKYGLILIIGLQIAFLITYSYILIKDNLVAGEGIRDTLTYQGKIANADGVPPPDGDYNLQFKIYDDAESTNDEDHLLWIETWDGTNQGLAGSKVHVENGIFTVELNSLCGNWTGDCAPYNNGGVTFQLDNFYLQVEFDYSPEDGTYEEVFLPRKRFTATPYSMNADKLDGKDSTEFLLKTGGTMTGQLVAPDLVSGKITDNSLIAYYQFNQEAKDSSQNALDATLNNEASVSENILDLDGTDQYLSIIDDDKLSFVGTTADLPFTIMAWVNAVDASNFEIFNKGVFNAGNAEYRFYIDADDKLRLQIFDESVADCYLSKVSSAAITATAEGNWVQVAATYDGTATSTGIKLYLNGTEVTSVADDLNGSSYVSMENLTSPAYIGLYNISSPNYSNGKYDEMSIYKRALAADEIKRLYGTQFSAISHNYSLNTHYLVLEAINNNTYSSGNLFWEPLLNRIKFSSEVYLPENNDYAQNLGTKNDYTHFADPDKILAYDFGDMSGGMVAEDLTTDENDCTFNGNTAFTNAGVFGNGMKVLIAGDSATINNAISGINSTTGSIELWARLNNISDSGDNYLFSFFQAGQTNELKLFKKYTDAGNPADLMVAIGSNGEMNTGVDVEDYKWHHYALTWDNGYFKVYLDGMQIYTSAFSGLDTSFFDNYIIGAETTSANSLIGSLDSFAVYSNVLSSTEILSHAQMGFNDLYVANLTDGQYQSSVQNLLSSSSSLLQNNKIDPVYAGEGGTLSLAFSENYGTTTQSQDNNTYYAAINGATWTNHGYYGPALEFDGINDNLVVDDNGYDDTFDIGPIEDFTIEFWVKGFDDGQPGADNAGKRIISKREGNVGYEVYFDSSDKISFYIGDASSSVTSEGTAWDISDNRWHHVLIGFDRDGAVTNAIIVRDAWMISVVDISSVSGGLTNSADLYIGSDSSGNFFKGTLDSVMLRRFTALSVYDSYNRVTNSSHFLIIANNSVGSGSAPFASIVGNGNGSAGIFAINNSNNPEYPLKLLNVTFNNSSGNDIYKMLAIGTMNPDFSQTIFGNLMWDNSKSRFVFDQGLHQQGNDSNVLEGNTRIGSSDDPTTTLDVTGNIQASGNINATGNVEAGTIIGNIRVTGGSAPTGGCTAGDFTYDSDNLYICTETDVWESVGVSAP